jgi:hypothetical protein
MKPGHIFILVLNILISIGLVCVVVRLFANGQEKDRLIAELRAQKQVDAKKALQAQEEVETQQQFAAQIKLEEQKKVEARNQRRIEDDLNKIDARLKRILDQPSGFADETKAQRDTQEELLRQIASCAKTEIGILVTEMQSVGFTNEAALQQNLDAFCKHYEARIHAERLSYDWLDLGFSDTNRKKELDAETTRALQAAFAAKRAISALKSSQKNK